MRAWSAIARNDMSFSIVLAVLRLVAELLRGLFNLVDDRLKEIDLVVAEDLARLDRLHRGRHALEAGAGIDVLLRQRSQRARRVAVELDENEIAHLDESLAAVDVHETFLPRVIFFRSARGLAAVDADFRARAAWPRLAHLPEIILVAELKNAISRQHAHLEPDVFGLFVVPMHRRVEQLRIDLPDLGDQLPMPSNRFFLVVVAERPVAEHLEEGVMVSVAANRFEIVVLARNAQAFLHVDDAQMLRRSHAQEIILELHHPGVGEEQGRVALGNQGGRRHDRVATLGEEVEKRLSYFSGSPAHKKINSNREKVRKE